MSKENAVQFLKKCRENEKAEELMKSKGKLDDAKSMAQALSEVAKEMGEEISPEDFAKALEAYEAEMRQNTDSVVSSIEELEDSAIDNVAGGWEKLTRKDCLYTFNPNDSCYNDDACSFDNYSYYCNGNYNDPDCTAFNFCDKFLNFVEIN